MVCDGVSRGMLFYCARKMARAAAIPISRLRIAPLVPLIGGENFRSEKKRNSFEVFLVHKGIMVSNLFLSTVFLNEQ